MVSPGDGLLTLTEIVVALGATAVVVVVLVVVVVVVAGVVAGVVGLVVVDGVIGVSAAGVLLAPPGMHEVVALVPSSPTLDGSSPTATGTEMTLWAPVRLE
jgi:hypothetical protein